MRYKITIEYDGTNFVGWQSQQNSKSVQETIEGAIQKFSSEKSEIFGAGRTDAGVHAFGQVGHFDLTKDFETFNVQSGLNFYLKGSGISIVDCKIVNEEFHARFSAVKRSYIYKILNRLAPTSIYQNRVWHIKKSLDIAAMQTASNILLGHHDFTSFRSSQCQAKSPMKTIESIEIRKDGEFIYIHVTAKSFLHHMVRNIVGTLHEVGLNKKSIKDVKKILEAKDRKKAGVTAPAHGLYFLKVEY